MLLFALLVSSPSIASLSQGSSGNDVRKAQERLSSWGYYDGKIDGIFAIGEEKAKVFRRQFPDAVIDAFYSDAWSDHFMAELAKKAYIVKGDGELTEWDRYFAEHPKR